MGSQTAAGRALLRRRLLAGLALVAMAMQTACYSYAPLQTSAPPKPRDAGVVLNDRGRVLLGERVGALTDRIDGRILSVDTVNVRMSVHRVTDLRGGISTWTGEEVTIPREGILGFRERKLSKLKTALLIGVAALAILTTLRTSLDIFGDGRSDPGPDQPPQGT